MLGISAQHGICQISQLVAWLGIVKARVDASMLMQNGARRTVTEWEEEEENGTEQLWIELQIKHRDRIKLTQYMDVEFVEQIRNKTVVSLSCARPRCVVGGWRW